MFIEPVVIECGHNFCKHCIKEWQKNFIEANPHEEPCPCPDCRRDFKTVYQSISLKNYINDLSGVILDQEEKKKQEETIKERLEKNKTSILGAGAKNETSIISLAQNAPNLAATSAPADLETARAGVGAIRGEEPNGCMHCCECLQRGQQCAHTRLPMMCLNCSQLLTERQQNIPVHARQQHTMEVIHESMRLYRGQAPTLSRSQIFLSPSTPSLAPPMNLVERNIQGQTPALGQTPIAPTLPRSQLLFAPNTASLAPTMNLIERNIQGQTPALGPTPVAPTLPISQLLSDPNAPSLASPMNLEEPDSTTLDIQHFRHFNGRVITRNLPRPSPYSHQQDHPRMSTNQTRTVGTLWNPL